MDNFMLPMEETLQFFEKLLCKAEKTCKLLKSEMQSERHRILKRR